MAVNFSLESNRVPFERDSVSRIVIALKDGVRDAAGENISEYLKTHESCDPGRVKSHKVYTIAFKIDKESIKIFAEYGLSDSIVNDVIILETGELSSNYQSYLIVSKLPGVTDDEGISAQKSLCDILNLPLETRVQKIFTEDLYLFENSISNDVLNKLADDFLGNPLVNEFSYGNTPVCFNYLPEVSTYIDEDFEMLDIFVSPDELMKISKERLLSLNIEEMEAIKDYYISEQSQNIRKNRGTGIQPSECELEIIAQTWSEHCKHKEFNALIDYFDSEKGKRRIVDSLFKTYIKKSTEVVSGRLGKNNWLIKVFEDNAGVVRVDKDRLFVWKVETHNSPSALDPFGGAVTGILGNNRDAFGTGRGGGKTLFNTNVLCFAPPEYNGKLHPGQLHPLKILKGVVKGIEDGGNKSGIPTINGSVVFDERFRGKPLVFCGTGAIMQEKYAGRNSWEKEISPGDHIVMAGGRVGKDGIHGATFSSQELHKGSPRSAVQIGSPITQKLLSDFLEKACIAGLVKCCTDNGAGGLSSSVGELAALSGGALVNLEKVPLKYAGLKPWEIFLSESQERMTLSVTKENIEKIFKLASDYEVEVSDIGEFTSSGFLDVRYYQKQVAYLNIDFLHNGAPRKKMSAQWVKPDLFEPVIADQDDYNEILLKLMGSLNICSREQIIRRYDHEVKGRTVLKPLMGSSPSIRCGPCDAGVIRLDYESFAGIAVSNGIFPRYGDIDPYEMSAGAFDEAVRQIIAVGGRLPEPDDDEAPFWSVNDNFCMPDSEFDPVFNPDGKLKLGKLVRMCEALYDMVTFYNIPMTSGKDSMKNDFRAESEKISVPPTILYSMASLISDVRKVISAGFKMPGDLIYILGETYDELGASEFYRLFGKLGANVPRIRKEKAVNLYRKIMQASLSGIVESNHDISDGGMIVAVSESAIGGWLGARIDIEMISLPINSILFSESHSRFIASVKPENKRLFEEILGNDARLIGTVTRDKMIEIYKGEKRLVFIEIEKIYERWSKALRF